MKNAFAVVQYNPVLMVAGFFIGSIVGWAPLAALCEGPCSCGSTLAGPRMGQFGTFASMTWRSVRLG